MTDWFFWDLHQFSLELGSVSTKDLSPNLAYQPKQLAIQLMNGFRVTKSEWPVHLSVLHRQSFTRLILTNQYSPIFITSTNVQFFSVYDIFSRKFITSKQLNSRNILYKTYPAQL